MPDWTLCVCGTRDGQMGCPFHKTGVYQIGKPSKCPGCGVDTSILGGGDCPRCSEIR